MATVLGIASDEGPAGADQYVLGTHPGTAGARNATAPTDATPTTDGATTVDETATANTNVAGGAAGAHPEPATIFGVAADDGAAGAGHRVRGADSTDDLEAPVVGRKASGSTTEGTGTDLESAVVLGIAADDGAAGAGSGVRGTQHAL